MLRHSPPPSLFKSLVYGIYDYLRARRRRRRRSLSLRLPLTVGNIGVLPPPARELYNGILGIRLDNAPRLARYSALFYAVRPGALSPIRSPSPAAVDKNAVP